MPEQDLQTFVHTLVGRMGFRDYRVELKDERRGAVFIYDNPPLEKDLLPMFIEGLNHALQLAAHKANLAPAFFDVNNYRQERENLIAELARAAARKASITKTAVSLPAMNSYERRLVHTALAVHPDVTTESVGEGKNRYVIVKPIEEKKETPTPASAE